MTDVRCPSTDCKSNDGELCNADEIILKVHIKGIGAEYPVLTCWLYEKSPATS